MCAGLPEAAVFNSNQHGAAVTAQLPRTTARLAILPDGKPVSVIRRQALRPYPDPRRISIVIGVVRPISGRAPFDMARIDSALRRDIRGLVLFGDGGAARDPAARLLNPDFRGLCRRYRNDQPDHRP